MRSELGDHHSAKSELNTSSSYTQSGTPKKRLEFPCDVTRIVASNFLKGDSSIMFESFLGG